MTDILNVTMLDRFVSFFNQYQSEPCTIVIHTRGGESYCVDTIATMINKMDDVTLLIHAVYSAGLELALKVSCKKILSQKARGMWHLGRADMAIAIDKKPYYDEDICHSENFGIELKLSEVMAKKIMTKKEFHKYKVKREEVWFNFKRMRQIFPNAKILE